MTALRGTNQCAVCGSRAATIYAVELRQDLAATVAVHPKIVVEKDGVEIALDPDAFA